MKKNMYDQLVNILTVVFLCNFISTDAEPLVIDHMCTDIEQIPSEYIDSAKANLKLLYMHRSHGMSIIEGLPRLQALNPDLDFSRGVLKFESNVLAGYQLPPKTDYKKLRFLDLTDGFAAHFFKGQPGWTSTNRVLDTIISINPEINVAMFIWCYDMNVYSSDSVQIYLDSMAALENRFPLVKFVYTTGNAQSTGLGRTELKNRQSRNEEIRKWTKENSKILYDFADLDCWWNNPETGIWEKETKVIYDTLTVEIENSHFLGDNAAHTTYESCEQKTKAFWWMMASLSGWKAGGTTAIVKKNRQNINEYNVIGPAMPKDGSDSRMFDLCGREFKMNPKNKEYLKIGNSVMILKTSGSSNNLMFIKPNLQ